MPATAGGRTSGSSIERDDERAAAEAPHRERKAVGVPSPMMSDVGDRVRAGVTSRASRTNGSRSSSGTSRSGNLGEERDERQRQEGERHARDQRREGGDAALPTASRSVPALASAARRQPEAVGAEDPAPVRGADLVDERLRGGGVGTGPPDDAHLVAHRRLRPPRQRDRPGAVGTDCASVT